MLIMMLNNKSAVSPPPPPPPPPPPAGAAYDPSRKGAGITLSGSDFIATANGGAANSSVFVLSPKNSGKYIFGFRFDVLNGLGQSTFSGFGNTSCAFNAIVGATADGWCLGGQGDTPAAAFYHNNVAGPGPSSSFNWLQGDSIIWWLDIDGGKAYCGRYSGGVLTMMNSGNPAAGTGAVFTGIPAGSYSPGCCPRNDAIAGNKLTLLTNESDLSAFATTGFTTGWPA